MLSDEKSKLMEVWNEVKSSAQNGSIFVPIKGNFGYYFQFHISVKSLEVFWIPTAWIPESVGICPNKWLDYTIISL